MEPGFSGALEAVVLPLIFVLNVFRNQGKTLNRDLVGCDVYSHSVDIGDHSIQQNRLDTGRHAMGQL